VLLMDERGAAFGDCDKGAPARFIAEEPRVMRSKGMRVAGQFAECHDNPSAIMGAGIAVKGISSTAQSSTSPWRYCRIIRKLLFLRGRGNVDRIGVDEFQ